jgi:hypothetical protein
MPFRLPRLPLLWLSTALVLRLAGETLPEPPSTAKTILERFLERSRTTPDRVAEQRHLCFRHSVTEELGADGRVKEQKLREFEVEFLGDVQHLKLLKLDGKTPSDRESRRELSKDAEMKRKYAERSEKARPRGPDFIDEKIIRRYSFVTNGVETVRGRKAYVLKFRPLPGLEAKETAERAMNQLAGRRWIDAEEFELVRVEAHLDQPLSLFGGIVATIERLDFEVERERNPDGFWFNAHFGSYAEGRKLFSPFRIRSRIEQDRFRSVETGPAIPSADGTSSR